MKLPICFGTAAVCALTLPAAASAQASDVSFRMPINVTQLRSEIDQVRVVCRITSAAIVAKSDTGAAIDYLFGFGPTYPVVNGAVMATTTVVVPIPGLEEPAGKTASYWCDLRGHRAGTNNTIFDIFGGADHPNVAFRLSPTPGRMTGTFPWVDPSAAPSANAPPNVTTSPGGNP